MCPIVVLQGIFAATLSAALSTLIGASRILQAISKDGLLGDWFRVFSKEKGEPVRAVVLCWALVQCGLACAWHICLLVGTSAVSTIFVLKASALTARTFTAC